MSKKKDISILSRSEERFCNEYVLTSNATQSYLKANPSVTYGSAKVMGCEQLTKLNIIERIEQLKFEASLKYNQSKDLTIKDLIDSAEEAKEAGQFSAYAKLRDMVIKIMGHYEPEKIDVRSQQTVINYIKPIK